MVNRYDQLERFIHERIEAALNGTRPEIYEELMPVLNTSGARLKKYFVRVLVEQFDKAVASELKAHRIPQKLAELQTAEERARVRQRKWHEDPHSVPKYEQPVVLPRLSTRELVDCRLQESRQNWLNELNERLSKTAAETNEMRARVERQKTAVESRLGRIHERLAELESASNALNLRS